MKEILGVIALGTKEITMKVAEVDQYEIHVLEDLSQLNQVGHDIFEKRRLSRSTIDECVSILQRFKRVCEQYGAKIFVVLTPALQEADNTDILVDNLISFAEVPVSRLSVNRELEYYFLYLQREFLKPGDKAALLKVGGGDSLLTLMEGDDGSGEKGFILFSRTIPVGPLRLKELYTSSVYDESARFLFQSQVVNHEFLSYQNYLPGGEVDTLYAMGPEVRMLAQFLLKSAETSSAELLALRDKLAAVTSEELFRQCRVPFEAAENLYSAAQILFQATQTLGVNRIRILDTGILDGMLESHLLNKNEEAAIRQIEGQVIRDSLTLGRSFSFDEKHALLILDFCLQIFDALKDLHKLPRRARLYLVVAALLHDMGQGISLRSHHKHSKYIIDAQEMLFLTRHEVHLSALVARYHRKSLPKSSHSDYQALSQEDRITVLKCAAILRLCDSLDYSHLQLIPRITPSLTKRKLILRATATEMPLGEMHSFGIKKELIENLFGIKVKLKVEVDG